MKNHPRVSVLGVGVHPIVLAELLPRVAELVASDKPGIITYANVHVLNTATKDPELTAFLNGSDLCYCDGNGVRLGARLLGRELPERMTGSDWIWDLAAEAVRQDWRVYWIGGQPGVTEKAAEQLRARHPEIQVQTDHGFHPREGAEDTASLDRINAFSPHIVLVGMGTPAQERWVATRRAHIQAPVVWCLGATADFISGEVARPGPAWLVEHHEWLSRLIADPVRLWRRYLLGNSAFLLRIMGQRLRGG